MAPARPSLVGTAVGSLAILAVVVMIAFGLPLLDHALPAARTLPDRVPFPVGAGVTVVPPAAASLDVSQTRPEATRGTALFTLGSIRYAVVVAPFSGSLADAAQRLHGKITAKSGYQVTSGDAPIRTERGVEGVGGGYDSPGRTGRYDVFVADGIAVEMTISGPVDELQAAQPVLTESIRSLAFGERS